MDVPPKVGVAGPEAEPVPSVCEVPDRLWGAPSDAVGRQGLRRTTSPLRTRSTRPGVILERQLTPLKQQIDELSYAVIQPIGQDGSAHQIELGLWTLLRGHRC